MPKKNKTELPVFAVVEMKPWQDKVLNLMLKILRVPGKAWVISFDNTGSGNDSL
jgi:hypothetical protein